MTPGDYILTTTDLAASELRSVVPGATVTHCYNPLEYARPLWQQYLLRFADAPREVVFLGMNPGPWGMAQTGIPFGEVATVREWLKISGPVGHPDDEHPRRPIQGLDCPRSEVSGRRLWGLFRERFGTPEEFFASHFVLNYCPLVFMGESGRNITPDKLPAESRNALYGICDALLADALVVLQPQHVVGVGAFARDRLQRLDTTVREAAVKRAHQAGVLEGSAPEPPRVGMILHPSPASPAANRGWSEQAARQLVDAGIWERN